MHDSIRILTVLPVRASSGPEPLGLAPSEGIGRRLAAGLAEAGRRVLLVELCGTGPGPIGAAFDGSSSDGRAALDDLVCETEHERVHVVREAEQWMRAHESADAPGYAALLDRLLRPAYPAYDLVVIAAPAEPSALRASAIVAADGFVVPVAVREGALEAARAVERELRAVWRASGRRTFVLGYLLTEGAPGQAATLDVTRALRQQYGGKVMRVEVGVSEADPAAPSGRMADRVAEEYRRVADEIVDRLRRYGAAGMPQGPATDEEAAATAAVVLGEEPARAAPDRAALRSSALAQPAPSPAWTAAGGQGKRVGASAHEAFGRVARMAARALNAPMACLSVAGEGGQRFAGSHGLSELRGWKEEGPLSCPLCRYVVREQAPVVMGDAGETMPQADGLVRDLGIAACFGYPIRAEGGDVIGAICVADAEPRGWAEADVQALADVAAFAESEVARHQRGQGARALSEATSLPGSAGAGFAGDGASLGVGIGRGDGASFGVDIGRDVSYRNPVQAASATHARVEAFARGAFGSSPSTMGLAAVEADDVARLHVNEAAVGTGVCAQEHIRQEQVERLTEQVRAAQEGLEAARKTQESILQNMSHELRTPLTAVIGCAEVLAAEVEGEQADLVRCIQDGGERLLRTLEGILELARLEGAPAPARDRVDVAALVEEEVAALRPRAAEKGIGLASDIPVKPLYAWTDAGEVRTALRALLDNAVEFTLEGRVCASVKRHGGGVRIEVADTGCGMAAEVHERVFDPFEQASSGLSRSHEGVGIGLALVKRIAAVLGATCGCESAEGAGSTFWLLLPTRTRETT